MSKKKREKRTSGPRASRAKLVLEIVKTDNTFRECDVSNPATRSVLNFPALERGWRGKCIHCDSKIVVFADGQTLATVEHIDPQCNGGSLNDVRNLALACPRCNHEKGIRHDRHAGKGGRADEVIRALHEKRLSRFQS